MASEPKIGKVLHHHVCIGGGYWALCPGVDASEHLSRLLSAAQEMREVLRELEWRSSWNGTVCPVCKGTREHDGHRPDCRLARLIGGGE